MSIEKIQMSATQQQPPGQEGRVRVRSHCNHQLNGRTSSRTSRLQKYEKTCTMRKMTNDDDESLRCTFVFLEATNDEIPDRGPTGWPPLHYMTQCCQPGVETSGLAKKKKKQIRALKHAEYSNTLEADGLDTAENTRTHSHHELECSCLQSHKVQVVDCNLFQIQILPRFAHCSSPL